MIDPSKIVLYGCTAEGDTRIEQILHALQEMYHVNTVVIPASSDREDIIRLIRQHHPLYILGIGASERGDTIRALRRAINQQRIPSEQRQKKILRSGFEREMSTLMIPVQPLLVHSYNTTPTADNLSLYVLLDFYRKSQTSVGFIQIPDIVPYESVMHVLSGVMTNIMHSKSHA
jgi:hypothetical protein